MTRDEAKQLLPVIQAFAEGKTIETRDIEGTWSGKEEYELKFDCPAANYRVKPEPKYRPFDNVKECWDEMQKHKPFGWVKCKRTETYLPLLNVSFMGIRIGEEQHYFIGSYKGGPLVADGFRECEFPDGQPFGIKVEDAEP